MSAVLSTLLAQFWPYIIGGIGALFALWQVRRSGAKAERAKQEARERAARDIADQIQNDVGAIPPAEARKELTKWSR